MSNQHLLTAIQRHPWVGDAHLTGPAEIPSVHVRPTAASVAVRPEPGALLREHLEHWSEVYDFVYAAGQDRHGDDLDLSGWRASDTGAPFPREHMIEWIDHAVGLVLRHRPRTVLELGCGSGLLAHRLYPHVESYIGGDVAIQAVEQLRRQKLPRVHVVQAAAHEITSATLAEALTPSGGTNPIRPDCVVLNSVTECFPNAAYLAAVVEDALDLVALGGTVIIGDVRNLACLDAFTRWVESAHQPDLGPADLAERAARRMAAEEELVCDPRLFAHIARRHPRTVRVTCHAKPMRENTELTRYRYDITLTADLAPTPAARPVPWHALPPDRLTALRMLTSPRVITGIPNALLDGEGADAATPAELAAALPDGSAVLLDEVDGTRLAVGPPDHPMDLPSICPADEDIGKLSNDPFARFVQRRLTEALTDHLERELPAAVPPVITVDIPVVTR